MKIGGHKISGRNIVVIPILRGTGNFFLKAGAIADYEDFEKLCPVTKAPMIMRAGETQAVPDVADPEYLKKIDERNTRRTSWMIIQSLNDTEDIEWETVKFEDPTTWINWSKELKESGFADTELVRIMNAVLEANSLDEEKVEQARKDFLAGLQGKQAK